MTHQLKLKLICLLLKQLSSNKIPSSKCSKVIMLPVCSWNYSAYGMYETTGCVASASEYGHDVYANSLENIFSNAMPCGEAIFLN